MRIGLTANEIINGWKELESEGFDLENVSKCLQIMEILTLNSGIILIVPLCIHVIKVITGLISCSEILNISKRKTILKKQINAIVAKYTVLTSVSNQFKEDIRNLIDTLITSSDEYHIASLINSMGFQVIFRDSPGPDFSIGSESYGIASVHSEAKSRLNRKYIGGLPGKSAFVNHKAILSLICRDAFTKMEEIFDRQKANIGLVNLSRSEYGDLLPMFSKFNRNVHSLKKAFEDGIRMHKNHKQVAILYSELPNSGMAAIALERHMVETVGKNLDHLISSIEKQGNTLGYYDIMNLVQNPKRWVDEIKSFSNDASHFSNT